MKKLILILFPLLLLCGSFVSCSDSESGGESESGETEEQQQEPQQEKLVKSYVYELNKTQNNSITNNEDKTFHKVGALQSVDNGDGTLTVKIYNLHYFSCENSSYKDLSAKQLIKILNEGKTEASSKYNRKTSYKQQLKKSDTETVIIPSDFDYTVYYYF